MSTSTSEYTMRNTSVSPFLSSISAALCYIFPWQTMLVAMLLGGLVSLLKVANESSKEILVLVPIPLDVFVILIMFASLALASILLDTRHIRVNSYLSFITINIVAVDFYLLTFVLLPSYLKPIPCILMSIVVLVMLYSSKSDLRATRDSHADASANPSNPR